MRLCIYSISSLVFVSLRMAPSEPKQVGDNTTYCIMNVCRCILLKAVK
jgi:hypothetical protein